ncbi:hypothetical protein CASFOL_042172 [Castilleja foliolosa]|uniref:Coatomer subunit beta n=1 Tax=Castilleja foliolosa TaxID=1961234 RepID=A0ABD3B9R0_9LAMI
MRGGGLPCAEENRKTISPQVQILFCINIRLYLSFWLPLWMNFLSNILREEGGFEYKKVIVDSVVILIRDIPDAKKVDCYTYVNSLKTVNSRIFPPRILHFLGNEGSKTSDPSKYIQYIYNRVILENATVRARVVSTLAKFGAMIDTLKPRLFVLLRRCLFDIDDEVRDRATLYLKYSRRCVDSSIGEAKDDGVEDEYQLEDFEVVSADYILKVEVSNFKNAWESLAEAVNTVVNLLGMQPCEGTEVVPSNPRSHVCLLSGVYIGNVKVLVRLSFGINGAKEVAMKLAVRSEDENVSDVIHEIVASEYCSYYHPLICDFLVEGLGFFFCSVMRSSWICFIFV